MEGEDSCRNRRPSDRKEGKPLPGDTLLHKSARSITTRWRPARKPKC